MFLNSNKLKIFLPVLTASGLEYFNSTSEVAPLGDPRRYSDFSGKFKTITKKS